MSLCVAPDAGLISETEQQNCFFSFLFSNYFDAKTCMPYNSPKTAISTLTIVDVPYIVGLVIRLHLHCTSILKNKSC